MLEKNNIGKYQIVKELGRGGFGIAYLARDIMLHREVALKVLYSQYSTDADFIQRFEREARLAATLDHPNIVPVYDFDQVDGRHFIAMGLMQGGSLKDKLHQHGGVDSELAKKIFLQIVEGLSYMHERGLVHRDIKPSNILFDHRGIARIGDFGFARSVQPDASRSLTRTGMLIGTPAYMAPEIWRGNKATTQSDVYSLGCVAYEMLSGNMLFDGESSVACMTQHLIDGPRIETNLPGNWQGIIERCLAKEPEKRYPSATVMLEDLHSGLFETPQRFERGVVSQEKQTYPQAEIVNNYKPTRPIKPLRQQGMEGVVTGDKPSMNIGVIGQSDHGKTTLTAAITKVMALQGRGSFHSYEQIDNVPEVSMHGINTRMAVVEYETAKRHYDHVDMYGYRDIVKNMISDLVPLDGAILVINALDGPIVPETMDQLSLARQIGLSSLVVFLNMTDQLMDPDLLELVEIQISLTLTNYGFPGDDIPIIRGSALEALQCTSTDPFFPDYQPIQQLLNAVDDFFPDPVPEVNKPFLMPIEDVFSIKGRGAVVTGQIQRGHIKMEDPVDVVGLKPRSASAVVASLETAREILYVGKAGDNLGILLKDIDRDQVDRGMVLSKPGSITTHTEVEAVLYYFSREEEISSPAIVSGIRHHFIVNTINVIGYVELPADMEMLLPGYICERLFIRLETEVACEVGSILILPKGDKAIGVAKITRILA